jgi:Flp pilus assembly protein TadG
MAGDMRTKSGSHDTKGQAFIELVLVLPMLILLLLGMIEVVFIGRTYLSLLDSTYQSAHIGTQGLAQYDNNEIYTVVTQDLTRKGYNNSSLIDVIIVRADLPGGTAIQNYHAYNMKGSPRTTVLTQAVLVSRLNASYPGGRLIAVEVVYDYKLLFSWPNIAGYLPNPFPIDSYTIQYVAR